MTEQLPTGRGPNWPLREPDNEAPREINVIWLRDNVGVDTLDGSAVPFGLNWQRYAHVGAVDGEKPSASSGAIIIDDATRERWERQIARFDNDSITTAGWWDLLTDVVGELRALIKAADA